MSFEFNLFDVPAGGSDDAHQMACDGVPGDMGGWGVSDASPFAFDPSPTTDTENNGTWLFSANDADNTPNPSAGVDGSTAVTTGPFESMVVMPSSAFQEVVTPPPPQPPSSNTNVFVAPTVTPTPQRQPPPSTNTPSTSKDSLSSAPSISSFKKVGNNNISGVCHTPSFAAPPPPLSVTSADDGIDSTLQTLEKEICNTQALLSSRTSST
eukprot:PhF_6_TR28308/c0_g1_i2/m.41924